ncbi:tRNA dimethylallyltransferase [Polytolypa hystricis UAMH7299]|uniref:tRNA dimethylallyltransferase n=1 Tax=Polytolypa hystricis (strain UAMH7299) TaxID=1447883 RepID=A0A2B7XWL9_POLH7|nr:tRNA dimethylallyltransferase [Polytolypa hystricis UAMH7299]
MSRAARIMEPLIAVIGATGTGKSKLAVDLATRFNGEIINGDAMQMYRGLPIITNQIPINERNGIPHHLLSCRGFDQPPWRIGRFKAECLKAIEQVRQKGKLPILVGGTHYYTQSVLFHEPLLDEGAESEQEGEVYENDGSGSSPSRSSEKFAILDASPEAMLQKLREVDPVMANRWHPNETRKIRRSLEIYLQTGRRASEIYEDQKAQIKQSMTKSGEGADSSPAGSNIEPSPAQSGQLRFPTIMFWTNTETETLKERLVGRVDDMAHQGLIREAQTLFQYLNEQESQGVKKIDRTKGVWVAIGFKELEPYFRVLSSGTSDAEHLKDVEERCLESVKSSTKQYAKQQLKWIRGKLWNALLTANATDKLYLVDTTNPQQWSSDVLQPAERVVEAFLADKPCPDPKSLSAMANEIFGTKMSSTPRDRSAELKCIQCEVCNRTLLGEEQYIAHIHSYGHKRKLKSIKKREEKERYRAAAEEEREKKTDDGDGDNNKKPTAADTTETTSANTTATPTT